MAIESSRTWIARSRNVFLTAIAPVAIVGILALGGCQSGSQAKAESATMSHGDSTPMTADAALAKLKEGNARFVADHLARPNQSPQRRSEVAKGQHPYAVILSCSDSRVPPEIVFDAGLGDVFIIRVAGNTADDAAIGSIEYAVEHLHAPLVVVLGHEACGAVQAAVDTVKTKGTPPGHLGAVITPIVPAVDAVKDKGGDTVDLAVRENVRQVVEKLKKTDPVLAGEVKSGHLKIVGARYDLDTGVVEMQ